jgi:hypothetical protein
MDAQKDLVPEQRKGNESNTESSKSCGSTEQAKSLFKQLKQRLLDVNHWHDLAGALTANFRLTDPDGNNVNRTVQKGDHFRIDIPGPGTVTGEGYDWVQVEEISETVNDDSETVAIRVRPATNPNNEKTDTAHFFREDATSSFVVKREGNKLVAAVYGRNEKPNTKTDSLIDKARNVAVATGAVTGGAKLQWKSLVEGLLKFEV